MTEPTQPHGQPFGTWLDRPGMAHRYSSGGAECVGSRLVHGQDASEPVLVEDTRQHC